MKLFKHQIEALEFLSKRRFAWIQDEMGLGKTMVMLSHIFNNKQVVAKVLVVCPKSVITAWKGEVIKFGLGLNVVELIGTTMQRIKLLNTDADADADVYVINYEGLRLILPHLLAKKFKTIVLDESHRIKGRTSKQTQACHALAKQASFRYAMSGTPTPKDPEDLWSQSFFVHPNILPNFWVYTAQYIDYRKMSINTPKGKREVRKAIRVKHSKEADLRSKMSEFVLRRTKKECLDLPDKIYKRIEVEMLPDQKRMYANLRGDLRKTFDAGELNAEAARASIHKLQQVAQGFLYSEHSTMFFDSCKIEALKDLLEDLEGKKILLFTWYKADIEAIVKNVTDREILIFDGNDKERFEIIKKFQNEDKPYIFLSNIERAKEGITLTAASDVIYFGNSYSYGSRVQSEDRVHRAGQRNPCVYYDIITKDTVDERITKILLDKKEMADAVTGDTIRLAKMELQ